MSDRPDLKSKLEQLTSDRLLHWLAWLMAFGGGLVVAVYLIYFLHFAGDVSNKTEVWAQFGDFVGGTAGPILSFFALIALLLTIVLQNKQLTLSSRELELSRAELAETRKELSRSAEAQEQSLRYQIRQAKAQEIEARISAIDRLLNQAESTIQGISSWASGSPEESRRKSADATKKEMIQELKRLYAKLRELDKDEA